jgi:hypothetical protein
MADPKIVVSFEIFMVETGDAKACILHGLG